MGVGMIKPFVSVVIPTYERAAKLERLLSALEKQTYKNFETIVVDDGSTDTTGEVAKNRPVKYVRLPHRGRVYAKNYGAKEAKGSVVLFLDDDVITSPKLVHEHARLHGPSDVGVVGGSLVAPRQHVDVADQQYEDHLLKRIWDIVVYLGMKNETGRILPNGVTVDNFEPKGGVREVNCVPGGNMSVRKSAFEEVGGFDLCYYGVAYREETDLCVRIQRRGYRVIFNPNAVVLHERRSASSLRYCFERSDNELYFVLKNSLITKNRYWLSYLVWDVKKGINVCGIANLPCWYKAKINAIRRVRRHYISERLAS